MTATDQGRLAGAERQLPGVYTLGRVLAFTVRLTGVVFGLVFGIGPLYLIGKFAIPTLRDPGLPLSDHIASIGFSIFALLFVAIGIFLLRISFRPEALPQPRSPTFLPSRQTMLELARNSRQARTFGLQARADGTFRLSSAMLYRGAALFIGLFTVVWNTVIFLSFRDLHTFGTALKVFQILFAVPFLSIGIGCIYVTFKLIRSFGQPAVEFIFQKAHFAVGETATVEVRLANPKLKMKRLSLILRKRHFMPETANPTSEGEPWVFEERTLVEKTGEELGSEWSGAIECELTEAAQEWAEWSLEAKMEVGLPRPLYLVAKLPFDRAP